jgi:hypothetical protein
MRELGLLTRRRESAWPYGEEIMRKIAVRALRVGVATLAAVAVVAVVSAWAVTVTQVPKSGEMLGVACGSTQSCVAIAQGDGKRGSQSSLVRIDGGAVGAVTKLGTFNPMGVACGSRSNCLAVGYTQAGSGISAAVLPIRNGVARTVKQVPGQVALFGVVCPTASTCIAVGRSTMQPTLVGGVFSFPGAVLDVITNGVPSAPRTVPGMSQLLGIACPSASDCVAVGTVTSGGPGVITLTNGNPGSPQPVSGLDHDGEPGVLGVVACATTTRCVAVGSRGGGGSGEGIVVPIRNGSLRPAQLLPRTASISDISCPTSTQCLAIGGYSAPREANGSPGPTYNVFLRVSATGTLGTIRRTSAAAGGLGRIACPSEADCVYVGGKVIEVKNSITVGVVVTSGYPSKTSSTRAR